MNQREENGTEPVCVRIPIEAKKELDERRGTKSVSQYLRQVVLGHLGTEEKFDKIENEDLADEIAAIKYEVAELRKCVKELRKPSASEEEIEAMARKREAVNNPKKKDEESIFDIDIADWGEDEDENED